MRCICLEVDAYSGEIGSVEFGFTQSKEDAALTDCLRPYDYDLECPHFDILIRIVHYLFINQVQIKFVPSKEDKNQLC
jgi:hypothetical protein